MAETAAKTLSLFPKVQEIAENRVYPDQQVKKILYCFARDIEQKRDLKPWRAKKLRDFIETVFNFD